MLKFDMGRNKWLTQSEILDCVCLQIILKIKGVGVVRSVMVAAKLDKHKINVYVVQV